MAQATHLLNIVIQVMDKATAGLNAVGQKIQQINLLLKQTSLATKLAPLGMAFNSVNRVIDLTTGKFVSMMEMQRRVAIGTGKIGEAFGGMNKQMLGVGLGMTFFMWGIRMQLDRMLRSMFNIFQQAEGETGALNQQFNIVRANLAAISIAFYDAFAQSGLFNFIITAVSKIAEWFLNLDDSTRQWLSSSVFVFSGIILGLSILGQAFLGFVLFAQLTGVSFAAIFSIWAIIVAGFVIFFMTQKDDIKTAWENLMDTFNTPDLTGFEKIKLGFANLALFLLEIAPFILAIAGAIWGGIAGGPLGAALGATLGGVVGFGLQKTFEGPLKDMQSDLLGLSASRGEAAPPSYIAEAAKVSTSEDLLAMIDKQTASLSDTMQKSNVDFLKIITDTPLQVRPSSEALKIDTTDPLNFLNEKDQEKIDKLQDMIDEQISYKDTFVSTMVGFRTSVEEIAKRPIEITINTGGWGGGSPTS